MIYCELSLFYVKMTFSYDIITSSMEFLAMQSRTPDRIIPTRRSSAWKCGSHSTGNVGSIFIDSFNNCDSNFGPFWNLFAKDDIKYKTDWNSRKINYKFGREDGKIQRPNELKCLFIKMMVVLKVLTLKSVQVWTLLSCSTVIMRNEWIVKARTH